MIRLILHRLLVSIPLLLAVTLLTYVLDSFAPGDVAATLPQGQTSLKAYLALRHKLGLDQPVMQQYGHWLWRALHGDLGTSYFSGERVVNLLNQRLGVTLSIVVGVLIVCVSAGLLLGALSALRGGIVGRTIDILSIAGLAFPSFWVALILIEVFAVKLEWLPAIGYTSIFASPRLWLMSLVLPVLAVALHSITSIAKQTRDAMGEVMGRDFIRALRASGLSETSVIWKHGLRNAALPVVTVIGLVMISALGSTVFVERIFVLPGLGSLAVEAATNSDIALLQGATLYFTLIVIAINLAVDVSYGWLNPKVRT
ncbi:MAG: ABC transporter permease [Hyphomicrobiales bacterium]|nr:ABC transporter permease [Hyphomicrobiales bacterium]